MKPKSLFLIILLPFIYSGCLIKSFNPFYLPKDAVFDEQILGNWQDQDAGHWTFEAFKPAENKVRFPQYVLNYREENGNISKFLVTLFSLDGKLYLDFLPDLDIISDHELLALHTLPVHSLAKVEIGEDATRIRWFNEEWAYDLIQSQKTTIRHELIRYDSEDATLVLTASTEELQAFIRQFGDDPEAFDCEDKYSGDTFCRNLSRIKTGQ
jgi:hypothetical protein